jgi:Zn-dependent membrane protease YugP
MLFYDSTWLLMLPGLILGIWAQYRVKGAYAKYARVGTSRGVSARQVARELLSQSGTGNVTVTAVSGNLTDHYDPRNKTLALSDGGSPSIAAIGVAAHECGHAMQAGAGYAPLTLRTAIVPVVNVGSHLYFPIFLLGIVLSWGPLITAGILCFAVSFVFSLISLPVEFNASRRAVAALEQGHYVTSEEMKGVKAVLNAAALTYVAAAVSSLLQLIRLILISRNRD